MAPKLHETARGVSLVLQTVIANPLVNINFLELNIMFGDLRPKWTDHLFVKFQSRRAIIDLLIGYLLIPITNPFISVAPVLGGLTCPE